MNCKFCKKEVEYTTKFSSDEFTYDVCFACIYERGKTIHEEWKQQRVENQEKDYAEDYGGYT